MLETISEWLPVRYSLYHNNPRRKKQKRNDEIMDLYKDGCSLAEIGRKYGISRQRVYQITHKKEMMEGEDG